MTTTLTIADLRERLFDAIDGLKAGTLDLDRARAISELSQVVVNTAKVEVDFIRATQRGESAFLGADGQPQLPPPPAAAGNGILGVRRHLIKDS